MKIILLITGLGMGGAERQVCDLVDLFTEKGHQVLLISLTGETVNRPLSDKVDMVILNMEKKTAGFIKAYWQVRQLIKQFQPDIVHSHMFHANIFARLLHLSVRIPKLICTAHSSNEGGRSRMLAYRITDSLCDLNTNVSQEAVDIFVKCGAAPIGRIIAMHNGIDTKRFSFCSINRRQLRSKLNLTDDTPLILAVGRLTDAKDYPNLLAAFSALSKPLNKSQLAIIGTGEEHVKISALVAELGLTERVHFLGMQRNVHEWMSAADIFVLSSAWEGFGLVVAEAMACERVVVATDCGGVKEVVGNAGFLVSPKDSEKLASAMSDALGLSLDARTHLGRLARKRIEDNYSLSSVCDRWLKIYSCDYNLSS